MKTPIAPSVHTTLCRDAGQRQRLPLILVAMQPARTKGCLGSETAVRPAIKTETLLACD